VNQSPDLPTILASYEAVAARGWRVLDRLIVCSATPEGRANLAALLFEGAGWTHCLAAGAVQDDPGDLFISLPQRAGVGLGKDRLPDSHLCACPGDPAHGAATATW
jgi:hypothetical protein